MAATGDISLAQDRVAQMLADSAAFRTFAGVATAEVARSDAIYCDGLPKPSGREYTPAELEALRPFALVFTETDDGFRLNCLAQGVFQPSGRIIVLLERGVPAEDEDDVAKLDEYMRNSAGAILDDLTQMSGQEGYVDISEIVFSGPGRVETKDVQDMGDFQQMFLQIDWHN